MKKWLLSVVAATVVCGTAVPVLADTTNNPANDHVLIVGDTNSPTVGTNTKLHINFFSPTMSTPNLQVVTTFGTLNGQSSSVSITPDANGNYPVVTLSSTVSGPSTVNVYESGVLIGTTQVTFVPGPIADISVQSTPTNMVAGGTATITIRVTDSYGNPIPDSTAGTYFDLTTTGGQLAPSQGIDLSSYGTTVSLGTHNGVAQALLSDSNAGLVTVTLSDTNSLPAGAQLNGTTGTTTVSLPITFSLGQSVTVLPVQDFTDTSNRPGYELESERELNQIGVIHGDPNHEYHPLDNMKRSEFASVVAQYMGLSTVSSNLQGTQTKFADVNPTLWYDGAIAADASLGYIHGDGTNFFPDKSISYAEVTAILLNNLGITTTGNWPDNVISGGQANGLFNGFSSFNANDPATRGDVAIMVRNALHLVPPSGVLNTNGKTLESELTGYTWYGQDQALTVTGVPGNGVNLGNELQVQSATQTTTLHLANSVQIAGESSLYNLMNKKIKYLTNAVGLVTYIEVTP